MKLEYKALVSDLKCGHELEFAWKGKTFTICCKFPHKWFFCIPHLGIVFEADSVERLLDQLSFDGRSFSDILPDVKDSTLF